jgi:hypothetical protein
VLIDEAGHFGIRVDPAVVGGSVSVGEYSQEFFFSELAVLVVPADRAQLLHIARDAVRIPVPAACQPLPAPN